MSVRGRNRSCRWLRTWQLLSSHSHLELIVYLTSNSEKNLDCKTHVRYSVRMIRLQVPKDTKSVVQTPIRPMTFMKNWHHSSSSASSSISSCKIQSWNSQTTYICIQHHRVWTLNVCVQCNTSILSYNYCNFDRQLSFWISYLYYIYKYIFVAAVNWSKCSCKDPTDQLSWWRAPIWYCSYIKGCVQVTVGRLSGFFSEKNRKK